MRFYELLEYKLNDQQKAKLVTSAEREFEKYELDQIIAELEEMDPTPTKKYMTWLVTNYNRSLFKLEDKPVISELLANYEQLKPRLEVLQRNVMSFTLPQLRELVTSILNPNVDTEQEIETDIPNLKVLYNGPLGLLAIPETEEASCTIGRGTEWCTAYTDAPNSFEDYNNEGIIYVWIERPGNKKYQIHFEKREFMNANNDNVGQQKIQEWRKHPVVGKIFEKYESHLLKQDKITQLLNYAISTGRWPEAEPNIMKDPNAAAMYSIYVIRDRWEEAEPIIASDANAALSYAMTYFDKEGWPEAEDVFIEDPKYAASYCNLILGKRWKKAEENFKSDPEKLSIYHRKLSYKLKDSDEFYTR